MNNAGAQDRSSPQTLPEKLRAVRAEIRDEYRQPHSAPWIIGFSGGKDSTLLLHLVVEVLLSIPPDERIRHVFVCTNDTLVESPVFARYLDDTLATIRAGIEALGLPITIVQTKPRPEDSFWVNLLGRGYPAPKRMFRWCTDRLKIRPTTRFIREQLAHFDQVILLLGTRRSESAERSKNIAQRSTSSRLNPRSDLAGCYVFTPIVELSTDEVWTVLLTSRPPWGGTYKTLIRLYTDADASPFLAECPFVTSEDDPASCGTTSARFGCWTCTVVQKDSSIEALIEAGHTSLRPLAAFRNRIKHISEHPAYRSKIRRNGLPGLGPLTIEARKLLLDELLVLQSELGVSLITPQEIRLIREQWARDTSEMLLRDMALL